MSPLPGRPGVVCPGRGVDDQPVPGLVLKIADESRGSFSFLAANPALLLCLDMSFIEVIAAN